MITGSIRPEPKETRELKEKKREPARSIVIISILVIILALVIFCIITLKFFPYSLGAYYIHDMIVVIEEKLSRG